MAKAKANGAGASTTAKSQLPEGFKSVRADRAEYFYKPVPGSIIRGLLKGRFPKKGRYPGWYYQVQIFEPVVADHKIGEGEYESTEAPAGSLLNVDEKGGLQCLAKLADGTQEVFIACGQKRDIGNGQKAWDFEVGARPFNEDNVPF